MTFLLNKMLGLKFEGNEAIHDLEEVFVEVYDSWALRLGIGFGLDCVYALGYMIMQSCEMER